MVYLYNELAALRDQAGGYLDASERYEAVLHELRRELGLPRESVDIDSLGKKIEDALVATDSGSPSVTVEVAAPEAVTAEGSAIKRALTRRHKMVQIFSICPAPELLINTAEFWKTRESGHAFRLMYRTTANELRQFFERDRPAPDWIRMARVSPEGEVNYLMDF